MGANDLSSLARCARGGLITCARLKKTSQPARGLEQWAYVLKAREATQGPAPDRDGDSDDESAVKSAVPPGVGGVVDKAA